jgi:hypothetical protein
VTKLSAQGLAKDGERGMRLALVGVFVVGLRRRNLGAVVNAVLALAGAFVPSVLERLYSVEFKPWQRLYVGTAMLTHAVGMLGPYNDTWWWDHLTHTHSATLVGGVVHVVSSRRGKDPGPRVLAAVAVTGVGWELAEYAIHSVANALGIEPILMTYGRTDTIFDLCFNVLGALIVLAFGEETLQNLVDGE